MTLLEILLNRQSYDSTNPENDFFRDVRIFTSQYHQLVTSALQEEEYAEMAHVYALSAALGQPILSYLPPQINDEINGCSRIVRCRNVVSGVPLITIMWTSTVVPDQKEAFHANHFVPLVNKLSCIDFGTIDISSLSHLAFGNLDMNGSVSNIDEISLDETCNNQPPDAEWQKRSATEIVESDMELRQILTEDRKSVV